MAVAARDFQCMDGLLNQVQARLAELGQVETRPMFAGTGVYVDQVLVALVRDECLYLRHPGKPADGEGFCPFPGARLRLNFRPVSDPDSAWERVCADALAEVRELARRIPTGSRHRAVPIDVRHQAPED